MKKEEFIEELETLILNNEDDFDRGRGKFILREFISSLKSSLQDETSKVGNNEENGNVCVCKPPELLVYSPYIKGSKVWKLS